MEIGLREWLIVIGIIVIAGILFDGWRRMRGGKGKLKFRLDRNLSNLPDDDGAAELLGPPRVLDTHKEPQLDEHDLPSMSAPLREAREPSSKRGKRGSAAVAEPHQGDLNLDVDDGPSFSSRDDDFPDETSAKSAARQSVNDQPAAEEVLVISVICRDAGGFKGPALLQNILESGL
ncbi:MAG: cell division protein ZipA, partial [Pseudomonas sp.]|nr:cell division protein ZipA [Pseudomonas sp.]